ncbi:Inner membrane protein YphA [Planctomycetes bacterium MalM25]|nr:Inner membrane protein YphA [Planctomycetes bacterium MalM25]
MRQLAQNVGSVAGRVMISGIFLASALGNKIPNFSQVTEKMASEGVPLPGVMLTGAIAFLIAGGASVVLGYRTRFGAALLLVFLVLATYFFHDYWNFEGADRQMQMIQFMKNASLMGTMLLLISNGPGALSLDRPVSDERTT